MRIIAKQQSVDGKTTLYTQETSDGVARILTTYVLRPEKHIICYTTSVGCPISCQFCYAGPMALPISAGELYRQVYLVHQDQGLQERTSHRGAPDKPVLFSAMGEGEPLASRTSFTAVTSAMRAMGASFPRARLALSTTGINPGLIRDLAQERFPVEFKLQISLVSSFDSVRKELMGAVAAVTDIRGAVGYYQDVTQADVEWNLVLLDGVNDSNEEMLGIARLLGPGAKVKLNGYNSVPGKNFVKSKRVEWFASNLSRWGLKVERYQTDGWDIGAACGQFRAALTNAGEL